MQCSSLLDVHRALGAVRVERDDPRRLSLMHRVDPATRQIGKTPKVFGPVQQRSLKLTHGAPRCRSALHRLAADLLAHRWVATQSVRVIDILVAPEPREDRLPQEPREVVPPVPADVRLGNQARDQIPVQEQSPFGTHRRAVKHGLHRAVGVEPEGSRFILTCPDSPPSPHSVAANPLLSHGLHSLTSVQSPIHMGYTE